MSILDAGAVLEGKYEIVRLLGSGGMGDVYLARHLHLDETRVIKLLRADIAADEASQKRFLREARLATQIKHSNVAILHDCSRLPEGGFFMVWEHVEGNALSERLKESGRLPMGDALDLGIQALRGLEAIHSIGVIHRDVAPDNLMTFTNPRGDLRLKIIDLGLARTLAPDAGQEEVTKVGTFMGKLRYCSPEQAQMSEGAVLDRRTDLYSLGVVLYEMISGEAPFEGRGPAVVYKRVSEDPIPLARRVDGLNVPGAVSNVVMRAVARDREDRYPDAVSFIEALDQARSSLSEVATRKIAVAAAAGGGSREGSGVGSGDSPRGAAGGDPGSLSRSGELTREERQSLLAQIDRAAEKVKQGTLVFNRAQEALDAGRLSEARSLIERLEKVSPGSPSLAQMRQALEEAESSASAETRLQELEDMLTRYIKNKQKPLAKLALDSLLDLAPTHPRRSDFESWVELMDEEKEQDERVAKALAAGREALAAGADRKVRRQLDTLRKLHPETAEAFAAEVEAERSQAAAGVEMDELNEAFEADLEKGDLKSAARRLDALEGKVSRLTLDGHRDRLAAEHRRGEREEAESAAAAKLNERLGVRDWAGAREVVRELADAYPESERAREMAEDVGQREGAAQKRAAVEDGERQIESLIAAGDTDQARLALKVLLQMDPENPHRLQLQRQIDALDG